MVRAACNLLSLKDRRATTSCSAVIHPLTPQSRKWWQRGWRSSMEVSPKLKQWPLIQKSKTIIFNPAIFSSTAGFQERELPNLPPNPIFSLTSIVFDQFQTHYTVFTRHIDIELLRLQSRSEHWDGKWLPTDRHRIFEREEENWRSSPSSRSRKSSELWKLQRFATLGERSIIGHECSQTHEKPMKKVI